MKISNLPKAAKSKGSDLITIVQGNTTKVISVKDFKNDLIKNLSKLTSDVNSLKTDVVKKTLNKNNPTLSKNLKIPNPKSSNDAATKSYVDVNTSHRVKIDGTSKIAAPLTYSGAFSFKAKDLVTKEYADKLLDATLKTVSTLPTGRYPKAAKGDLFISDKEYASIGGDGPALQQGDILICLEESAGGTHGEASSQFAIINTNVVLATELESGIIKIASTDEVNTYSSDDSAITPLKLKNNLLTSSLYNRTLVDSANYKVTESDKGILAVDSRRAAATITLPSPQSLEFPEMFKITVKDEFGSSALKNITVNATGSTIDASANIILSNNFQAVTLYTDGKQYYTESNSNVLGQGSVSSGNIIQSGAVFPSAADATETMYSVSVDLSQFDYNEGFEFEVAGTFGNTGSTKDKIVELLVGGITTVTNSATPHSANVSFFSKVTVLRPRKYASAYGAIYVDGVAPDTYSSYELNLDWSTTITVAVTAFAETTANNVIIQSAVFKPLK